MSVPPGRHARLGPAARFVLARTRTCVVRPAPTFKPTRTIAARAAQFARRDRPAPPGSGAAASASNCPAETTNNCVLTQTNSGNTDTGACSAGFSGSCAYSCSNGAFSQVTNTCAAAAQCSATTTKHSFLTQTNSGSADTGTCSSGYTGSCAYSCSNGAFSQVTNTCAAQCPAQTTNNCVLTPNEQRHYRHGDMLLGLYRLVCLLLQ